MDWIEILCRWALGLQFLFWGANGFFLWKAIPPAGDFLQRFNQICVDSKFIMPVVKVFEIFFGALLLTGHGTWLALIFLGPIVFVISGLHWFHNPKWQPVIATITLPFIILLGLGLIYPDPKASFELCRSLLRWHL